MFSLNSLNTQNQILLNLGQLTTRQSFCLLKQKKNNAKVSKRKCKPEILCSESLAETSKNCDSFPLAALQGLDIGQILSKAEKLRDRFVESRTFSDAIDPLRVSYISCSSFEENRLLGPYARHSNRSDVLFSQIRKSTINSDLRYLERYTNHLIRSLCSPHFSYDVQRRGFKTDRSMEAEKDRNPTFISRLKKMLGLTPLKAAADSSRPVSATPTPGVPTAKLGSLLDETLQNLSPDQKNKIKIAFAEGYMAGSLPENQRSTKTGRYLKVIQQLLTIVIFLAIFVSLIASASGSMFRIQLGNQVEVDPEDISVTFDDVKGADEAKQELKDVVEFLKSPEKFSTLGGKLPKGVLLVGPPGTGKTLLARAVAGEAGVPFFHAAGPEFDEILVGQGARRVRDLFKAAKERAPCVIFIDEIDSVGAKRTNSVLHPYANQTINQLLSEMDGFHQNEGVIVLGATNRRDDLDTALLRPGRFDVEVTVPTPDYSGRKEILVLYLSRVLHAEIDVELLARGTAGFTGADLENMVNQAALRAAIDGAKQVTMKYLEGARDKVLMGPERKSRLPDEDANLITAYHEGGHAIVAYYTKESHPLHKVTIIPRGPSLGHTAYIPAKERYHVTKQQLLAMMDTMMGGRAAEELIFGPEKITSGASSDLKQATSIAHHMVKDWGMSEKVGLRTFDQNSKGTLFGPSPDQLSANTTDLLDSEIKRILNESYERAKHILRSHAKEHKALAEALIQYETLDAEDIKAIMNGDKISKERHPKIVTIASIKPDPPIGPNLNLPSATPAGPPSHHA